MTENKEWLKHNHQRNIKWFKNRVLRIKKMPTAKKKNWIRFRFSEVTIINTLKALVIEAEKDDTANSFKINIDKYIKHMEAPDSEYVSRAETRHWEKKLFRPVLDYLYEQRGYAFRHGFKHHYTMIGLWIGGVMLVVGSVKEFYITWFWYYSLSLVVLALVIGSLIDKLNNKKV